MIFMQENHFFLWHHIYPVDSNCFFKKYIFYRGHPMTVLGDPETASSNARPSSAGLMIHMMLSLVLQCAVPEEPKATRTVDLVVLGAGVYDSRDQNQCLIHAKHILYHWSHLPNPLTSFWFWATVSSAKGLTPSCVLWGHS